MTCVLLWLFAVAALVVSGSIDVAMPDPVTEQSIQDCELALQTLKSEHTTCENAVLESQRIVGGKVEGYKAYFTDVENQMKKLEPGIAKLKADVAAKYKEEAEMYAKLTKESKKYSFLKRRVSQTPAELLVDRWLKCDDDKDAAATYLNGCKTKLKTVTLWNDQRTRQYKNKADVYIMRTSRQDEPVRAHYQELARSEASIGRMETQVASLSNEKRELICPLMCQFPACAHGEPGNGGKDLADKTIWGSTGCTHYCSRPFTNQGTRFCGAGAVYTDGAYIDCTGCAPS